MVFDMQLRQAKYEKKMMAHKHEQEAAVRQQTIVNRNINDALTNLAASLRTKTALQQVVENPAPSTRGWALPPSITTQPIDFDAESYPKLTSGPPRFSGENAVKWIRMIQKYYNHNFTPLVDRLYLTSFLFDDEAEDWLAYFEDNTASKSWDSFLLAVKKRFDPDLYEDYVGRLATLRQTSTLEAYQTEFEGMLQRVTDVGDSTLTSLFVAGLKPALKQELLTRRPATLQDAFALAQQLAICQAVASPVFSPKPSWQNRGNNTVQQTDPNAKKDIPPDQKQITCLCKEVLCTHGVDDGDDELSLDNETTPEDDGKNMAITGDVSRILVLCPKIKPRSIHLRGRINGTEVSILIDGGSTHNFIQPAVAEKLSLPVNAISPFRGHQFGIDLYVLQVKSPDFILGVQWLQDLGDITKNYRNLTMRFEWNDQPVFLRGEDAPPRPISYNNLFSFISSDSEADIFELLPVQTSALQSSSGIAEVDPSVSQVLSEFASLFDLPKELPPARRWDHRIHLPNGTKPVNVRPYRYPYFQKAEIERQIVEMLNQGSYNTIRMHVDDIYKTAFRTHEGHYEFLVMPFGLTNAPSTFQAAMNSLFQPFLRQFVIDFFDDILVYSTTPEDHQRHLRQVLHIQQDNTLFVKQSKCAFGVHTIDYLGHIILAGGLHADPARLEAMDAWPVPTSVKQLRGFLGLTGYYRRFVKKYSLIASPLTELLKKEAFQWTDAAAESFTALKAAMCSTPVLRLPDFELPFCPGDRCL
ncbi:uncharacterized protein LOC121781613 [Salvia splendens]|uniref:uncharacterized protein LOC121781613 n=1 Tax=Salvia splendens TaxID=180675 RepID=UPI001C271D78|nr:uncharacterized protein LOC121781613 [Salvia splendens]